MDNNRAERMRQLQASQTELQQRQKMHSEQIARIASLEKSLLSALRQLVTYLDGKTTKTQIVNQLKEIGTPDALRVVSAVNELHKTLKTHKNTDLSEVVSYLKQSLSVLDKLPKELPKLEVPDSVTIKNQLDYSDRFKSLEDAVKAIKLHVEAPVVNLPETVVNVPKTDLSPLKDAISSVVDAVKDIKYPELPRTDLTKVEKELKTSNEKLQRLIEKPTGTNGGGGVSFQDAEGRMVRVTLTEDGKVPIDGAAGNQGYIRVPGLSFGQTVTPGGTYITDWVATSAMSWLRVTAEIPDTAVFVGAVETTTATDPNAPTASDIQDTSDITLAGDALGGISKTSFGLAGGHKWTRITATNATAASHLVKVVTDFVDRAPNPAILPLIAALNPDYGAAIVRSVIAGQLPSGQFSNVGMDTTGNLQTSIDAITAEVPIKSLSALEANQQTVGLTAVQIPNPLSRRSISIKAPAGNTGTIYVGHNSAVSSGTGFPLVKGESIDLEIDETVNLWVIADAANQRIAWLEVS